MGIVDSKTFKSGNSIAVRLPREVAFAPDIAVTIERHGNVLTIRPADDPAEALARNRRLVEKLMAIGPADEVEQYDSTLTGPERPGLI